MNKSQNHHIQFLNFLTPKNLYKSVRQTRKKSNVAEAVHEDVGKRRIDTLIFDTQKQTWSIVIRNIVKIAMQHCGVMEFKCQSYHL